MPISYHNGKVRYHYKCPECGANLSKKNGRYGAFFACSNYNCGYTEDALVQKYY
ncbi:MAG: topoisomerase DNA-binding C4 zinc finger domain-containing protein [Methanobrevibacter sp.]|nr:topoisomerase DNA-binding C4 zinc finger domain-containing protein [Methanobrevibacter sp.]